MSKARPAVEEKPAATEEEKPAKKEQAPAPVKKKEGPKARLRMVFDVDTDKRTATFRNKKCTRCGATMAHHKAPTERWTCGACSYTDFSK
ncbi:MAG: 30S ribosomal protein S27ae [archaeon]